MKISEQIKKTEQYTVLTTENVNNISKDIHYLYQLGLVDGTNPCNEFELPLVIMTDQNTKFFTADIIEPPDMDSGILYIAVLFSSLNSTSFTCSFTVDIDGTTVDSREVYASIVEEVVTFEIPASVTSSKSFISLYANSRTNKLLVKKIYYGW